MNLKNHQLIPKSSHLIAALTASLLLAAPSVHASLVTNVQENFTGPGNALNGKTATTFASGITIAGGSSAWIAHTNFLDNGAVLAVSSSLSRCASLNLGTYINNVKGTADGYFELTLTISPTVGASWISLGFAQENTVNTNKNFTNTGSGTATTTGNATILYRGSTSATPYKLDMYGGTGNANAVAGGPTVSGSQTLTVVLDQTPAGGYNGVNNFGTVTWKTNGVAIGTFTYTTTRTFGSILVSQAGGNSGTISALTLAQTNTSVPITSSISVKTNNTDNLNLTTSWVGGNSPFNTTNIAKWDKTVTSANTVSLGADTIWGGINISNPVGTVTINAGNTLTLGDALVDIDMSQATADLTLNCALALGANNVWDVTNSRTLTVGGAVSGPFNLTKQNLGGVILTAANSYTGTNTIAAGTLTLSGAGNLGNTANNLTLGGGGLDLGGSSQTVGAVSITAARASGQTITNGNLTGTSYAASSPGGNAIISANLLANGAAGFTNSGAGTVTLLGNNTYTGATAINAGTVNIQNANALGTTAGGTTVANGATLQLQGGLSFAAEPLMIGSGTSTTPTLQSVSGDNTWTGTIDSFGAATYTRIQSDTNLLTLSNTITGNDAATSVILQGAGSILVSGKITGPAGLLSSALGAGTRTLSNPANDFNGQVQLNGGTLRLGASEVIPDGFGKGNVTVGASGATFDLNGYSETINGLSSTFSCFVDNTATNTTSTLTVGGNDQSTSYAGVIRNTGGILALTKIGSGLLTLIGTNTYTGNTIVSAGTLELGVASIAASSTVSVADGAVLQLDFAEGNVVSGFVTNGVSLPAGFAYSAGNMAPFISGSGSLVIYSSVAVVKANNTDNLDLGSSWVGGSPPAYRVAKWDGTVTSANTVNLGTDTTWGGINISNPVGTVTINAGNTLTLGAVTPVDIDMSLATADLTLNCDLAMNGPNVWDVQTGRTLTLGGIVSGAQSVTKKGAGTAILSGANTYSGTTTISAGALKLGAAEVIPDGSGNGNVTVDGTLDLNGNSETINGLSGSGTVDNTAASTSSTLSVGANNVSSTFGGVIKNTGGTLSLTKTGSGTLTLSGTNTYASDTTLVGTGTLAIKNASTLGRGTLNLSSTVTGPNTTLQIDGGINFTNAIVIDSTTGREGITTTNGSIALSGPTIITGAGNNAIILNNGLSGDPGIGSTLAVSNTFTATGGYAGSISLRGSAGNFGKIAGVVNAPLMTLQQRFFTDWTITSTGNNWALTQFGGETGNFVLGANNALATSAPVQWSGSGTNALDLAGFNQTVGGLDTTNPNALVGNSSTNSNSTLTINGGGYTYRGIIADTLHGTGSRKTALTLASGTQTLTGANTYSGNTTISAGTLVLANDSAINLTAGLNISAGATLDTVALTVPPPATIPLTASGTGTNIGVNAATIIGVSGYPHDLGSRHITLNYDGANPALYLAGGTLNLNNNAFTINGSVLTNGVYAIIAQADAFNITGSVAASTVNGTALTGKTGTVSLAGNTVVLTVSSAGPSGPAKLTNSLSGGVLSLSWPAGQGWRLQQQTNSLSKGLSTNWVYVTDSSASSTNITVDPAQPTVFYRLTYP